MSSVDWLENITDQFGKVCDFSGQSNMKTNSSRYRFIRIQIQIHSSETYADFIHSQYATNYKVQGTDLR